MAAERSNARSKFHTTLRKVRPARPVGPINRAAIRRDAELVLDKAGALLGYRTYLAEARSWKARSSAVSPAFEREVQAQAAGALADTHALASAALRMTSQFKHSGRLDRMFSGWVSTLQQTGSTTSRELLDDLRHDASLRKTLEGKGVSEETWDTLLDSLSGIDASVSTRDGKVVADIAVAGEERRRTITFAPTATGMPRTLPDLLRRGTFEQLAPVVAAGAGRIHLLPGEPRDVELADAVLAAATFSMDVMAAHTRGLRDAGLAKYEGNAPVIIWAVAALACLVIGYLLVNEYCPDDPDESPSAACIAGMVLSVLGYLGTGLLLFVGLATLFPAPPGSTPSCPGTTVYVYDPDSGKFVFDHCDPFS